eukprot:TRINITY_DN12147_c0_g1_i2.p1 TRINITY_DN12147_c0_g1~~TRINITY_DN12147_c0_g1_i2.p1  ORF type:complete len:191 (-),score=33.72 TRINITY_DN12147_c0_g1_i2:325-816(-)
MMQLHSLASAAVLALALLGHLPDAKDACPPVEEGQVGVCVEECSSDTDCETGQLCCSNGCGHVCMKPAPAGGTVAKAGAQAKTSLYAMIAVYAKGSVAAEILPDLPSPHRVQDMQRMNMVILHYHREPEKNSCEAFQTLSKHPKVESVEWDGPHPDCGVHEEL